MAAGLNEVALAVNDIPAGDFVDGVREDTNKPGLLYEGTEKHEYFSMDGGSNQQSLQLNLPVASIRDIGVREDNPVLATVGREPWIHDDPTELWQRDGLSSQSVAILFKLLTTYRERRANLLDPCIRTSRDSLVKQFDLAGRSQTQRVKLAALSVLTQTLHEQFECLRDKAYDGIASQIDTLISKVNDFIKIRLCSASRCQMGFSKALVHSINKHLVEIGKAGVNRHFQSNNGSLT